MSHQSIADAFAPAEAAYKAKVMEHTWGHLAPKCNKTYRGHIVFAIGCFGEGVLNPMALSCEFNGLDSSPWFYDAMQSFIDEYGGDDNAGNVYRFEGTFRNYEFTGTVQRLNLVEQEEK